MLLSLYLTAALAVDTTTTPPRASEPTLGRPAVIVHRQPAIPLVALRLALLADDPPGYAGAGHLVQHLVEAPLRDRVGRVGGRIRLERTSDAVVFSVSGPAGELGFLADALRRALDVPRPGEIELLRASRALAEERLADWETASLHVRAALRAELFPADLSAAGTESSALRLVRPEQIAAAWSAMYRPERISVVAVGDVELAEVEAAFADLPPARETGSGPVPRDTVMAAPLAPAQATRGWQGIAYSASDLAPATISIATWLAGEELRARLPTAVVEAEHWWTRHGQALVLVAAAAPADIPLARRAIGTALSAARSDLTQSTVSLAARSIRRDMLFYSRTPDRMADVLGAFTERSGDPDAADRFYAALDRVTAEEVRAAIDRLLERSPVRSEIAPQQLDRSR